MNHDTIEIRRLEVETHIGVPQEERATPQKLWVTVTMTPSQGFTGLADNIANTIDYYQVSLHISAIAHSRSRHLIETLATDIANSLLTNYPLRSVTIEIEKRILPNSDHVTVTITRP